MAVAATSTINFASQVDMSIVEAKVLQIQQANWIGLAATATSRNPQEHQAGTARYWTPELNQSTEYTTSNKNDEPDQPVLDEDEVQLNLRRKVNYEIETMDFSGLMMGGAIEGEIAKSLSLPMIAEMDARLIDVLAAQAISNGPGADAASTPGYIINADFSTTRDETGFKNTYFDIADMSANPKRNSR